MCRRRGSPPAIDFQLLPSSAGSELYYEASLEPQLPHRPTALLSEHLHAACASGSGATEDVFGNNAGQRYPLSAT